MGNAGNTVRSIEPLTVAMDTRAVPDQMRSNGLRLSQNWEVVDAKSLCRATGFEKLFDGPGYLNDDLHDQLTGLQQYYDDLNPPADPATVTSWPSGSCGTLLKTRPNGREPITMLFEAISNFNNRALFAGTQSRIYCRNASTKNWRIIADGYGGQPATGFTGRKFRGACLKDVVVFTNDFDPPMSHTLYQNPQGCNMQAVQLIPDLVKINLTSARIVIQWKGLMVLMNVVMDGQRCPSRVIWSDFNKPLSFAPATSSVTGFQDLDQGEEILNAESIGDVLFVYTTRAIWQLTASGNATAAVSFYRWYRNPDGHKCLVHGDSLVSTGFEHFFMSHEGWYKFSYYYPEPQLIPWAWQSSNLIYDNLGDCCEPVVARFWPEKKAIVVSWVSRSAQNCIADKTMMLFTEFESTTLIDHGFTALARVTSSTQGTYWDFLTKYCICPASDTSGIFVKEGLADCDVVANPDCPTTPDSIWTPVIAYGSDPLAEDFTAPMSANSLCAKLGDLRIDDLCPNCGEQEVMAGASGTDWCIKQLGTAFSREICTNPNLTGTFLYDGYCSFKGAYSYTGYTSRLLLGPLDFGKRDILKRISKLMPQLFPEVQAVPCICRMKIGVSRMAQDPLLGSACRITWRSVPDIPMACPEQLDEASLEGLNEVSWEDFHREVYEEGKFIYLDLSILNMDGSPAIGGAVCLSRLDFRGKTIELFV